MDFEAVKEFFATTQGALAASALVFIALYFIRIFLIKLIDGMKGQIRKRYLRQQLTNYIITVIGVTLITLIWYGFFKSFLTFLGLITGALIISSRELVLNLVANIVIFWRGVFQVGDRIQIGNHIGDVVETGPVFITLSEIGSQNNVELPTGSLIKIPNSQVLTQSVRNITRGLPLIWNEMRIGLTTDSDHSKAKKILLDIAAERSYKFKEDDLVDIRNFHEELMFINKEPFVFTSLEQGRITLCLNYICKFYDKRETESRIFEDILIKFKNEKYIEISSK